MQGLHLTADLHNCRCDPAWMLDAAKLGAWCVQAVQAAGLQPVHQLFHAFPANGRQPGGITASVMLAGSHLCAHAWPAQKTVMLDVCVCNVGDDHAAKARALMQTLVARFSPEWTEQRSMDRGAES